VARPQVEVVVPTRNRCDLLRQAVESIRRQTFDRWKLVVVDDASTDGTPEYLASASAADPRVRSLRLISHAERAAARNQGLAAVTSEFVLFLDDDDRLRPRALERLVRGLSRHPEAVEAIGARSEFDELGHSRRAHHVRIRVIRPVWPDMLAGWFAVPGQCLFRTEALRAVGGWSERIAGPEDQELQLRLSAAGPAVFIAGTVLEYRRHPGQWRPYDAAEVEDEIHEQFVNHLPREDRERGARLRRAHEAIGVEASVAQSQGRYGDALRGCAKAVHVAPSVLRSPLTGPPLLQLMGKAAIGSLLGSRFAPRARGALRASRRALKREPGGAAPKPTGSSSAKRK
jgi:glycosyltransferase involved in cell wall biosynthesis